MRGLLSALAFDMEAGPWWARMSTDAIHDAPVPLAVARARRVDPNLRSQLGKEAGKGTLARTGGKSVVLLQRVRKWKVKALGRAVGEAGVESRVAWYWTGGQEFFSPDKCHVLSVALDATRMSGRDTLYLAAYSPELGKGFWLPPQVRASAALVLCVPLVRFCGCSFLQFSARSCPFSPVPALFCTFWVSNRQKRAFYVCRFAPFLAQVCHDLHLGMYEVGEELGAEDTEEWLQAQAAFFTRPRPKPKGKAKGKAKASAKGAAGGKVVKARRSSLAAFRALDNALRHGRKRGLEVFLPTEGDKAKRLCVRHTLVLHYDEASPNLAMGQWMLYKGLLRIVLLRDVFHREWNDCGLALRSVGLWHVVLLTALVHNLTYGPWDGSAWFNKLCRVHMLLAAILAQLAVCHFGSSRIVQMPLSNRLDHMQHCYCVRWVRMGLRIQGWLGLLVGTMPARRRAHAAGGPSLDQGTSNRRSHRVDLVCWPDFPLQADWFAQTVVGSIGPNVGLLRWWPSHARHRHDLHDHHRHDHHAQSHLQ